ncbi:hypothetical protein GGR52DRAFT_530172 [Hypoxylon sp. FL1284]|nr:hypothetical protein GGR52DRAFT_530172 [Hypoxylon sp. FL1284]
MVGCEMDAASQQAVVQNVLRRVDRIDGGMSRQRWERGDGQVGRHAVGEIRRVPGRQATATQSPRSSSRPQRSPQARAHTSHTSHPDGDGALSSSDDEGGDCVVPLDSTIYVSILDPISKPAFKPSPTKPIPQWMQWLPSQRNYGQKDQARPYSILDEHFPPPQRPPPNDELTPEPSTVCPTTPPPQAKRRPAFLHMPDHIQEPGEPESGRLAESTIQALKGRSFVLDEPLKRPSSRMAASPTSIPATAKEEPTLSPAGLPDTTLSPRSLSPFVPSRRSPLSKHEADARHSGRRRPSSPLTEQVAGHLQRYMRRTPPAQSREFLNRYGPATLHPSAAATGAARATKPGIAVPGRAGGARELDGGRQVRAILERDRTPSPLGVDKLGVTDGGDVVDLRSARKRSSLQVELKRLLGGGRGQSRERG